MKLLLPLLSLAAATSAIDIVFYRGNACQEQGNSLACTGSQPGGCCSVHGAAHWVSVGFQWVPQDWGIAMFSCHVENCDRARDNCDFVGSQSSGKPGTYWPTQCIRAGDDHHSAFWQFYGKKKMGRRALKTAQGQDCQRADTYIAKDGKRYGLEHLDDDAFLSFAEAAGNGTLDATAMSHFALQKREV